MDDILKQIATAIYEKDPYHRKFESLPDNEKAWALLDAERVLTLLQPMLDERERYRKALEFYADSISWWGNAAIHSSIERDGGTLARKALTVDEL